MSDRPVQPLRVLHAAVRDRGYPRARRMRDYLGSAGDDVITSDAVFTAGRARNVLLTSWQILRARGPFDAIVLAEFSTQYTLVTLAKARLHGAVHVVDGFVGLHETVVLDRGSTPAHSMRARLLRLLDLIAIHAADIHLTDTEVRAARVRAQAGRSRTIVMSVPVGAPEWARPAPMPPRSDHLRVLYYGGLIPLHGFPSLMEGVALAASKRPLRLTAVGPISRHAEIVERLDRRDLRDVARVVATVPESELAPMIAEHDVVVGVFGGSAKAESVIANKVWQALASGRPVLTRESLALDELPKSARALVVTVPPEDPHAIAELLIDHDWEAMRADQDVAATLQTYTREKYDLFHLLLLDSTSRRRRHNRRL